MIDTARQCVLAQQNVMERILGTLATNVEAANLPPSKKRWSSRVVGRFHETRKLSRVLLELLWLLVARNCSTADKRTDDRFLAMHFQLLRLELRVRLRVTKEPNFTQSMLERMKRRRRPT
jgi:hypothetical protein